MAHQLLHSGEVNAGIEEIARKRPPQVVGSKGGNASCLAARVQNVIEALIEQLFLSDSNAFLGCG